MLAVRKSMKSVLRIRLAANAVVEAEADRVLVLEREGHVRLVADRAGGEHEAARPAPFGLRDEAAGGLTFTPEYSGKTSSPPSKSSLRLSETANERSAVVGAPLSRWAPKKWRPSAL